MVRRPPREPPRRAGDAVRVLGERLAPGAVPAFPGAALKAFRSALQAVIHGPATAERVAERAKWLPRTIAAVRGGQDVGHGYQPDVDHGVRVNIAPLVEKKLLPRIVLKRLGGS